MSKDHELKIHWARPDELVETPEDENSNSMPPHKYRMLVEFIRRVGWLEPVVVERRSDGRLHITNGNHRKRAGVEAGKDRVPYVLAPPDVSRRFIRTAMNRLRGDPNLSKVANDMAAMLREGFSEEDLQVTGFDADEVNSLLASTRGTVQDVLADVNLAEPEPPREDKDAGDHKLEVEGFATRAEVQRARRALRKAAGKKGTLAQGLLALIDEKEEG